MTSMVYMSIVIIMTGVIFMVLMLLDDLGVNLYSHAGDALVRLTPLDPPSSQVVLNSKNNNQKIISKILIKYSK